MEEGEVVALGEVDLALAPLDVLEPDLVLEVDPTDGRGEIFTSPNLRWNNDARSANERWAHSCRVEVDTRYPM